MPHATSGLNQKSWMNNAWNMTHLGQPPSDRPRPLRSQVQRSIFLGLVKISEILARFLIHHGQDPSN